MASLTVLERYSPKKKNQKHKLALTRLTKSRIEKLTSRFKTILDNNGNEIDKEEFKNISHDVRELRGLASSLRRISNDKDLHRTDRPASKEQWERLQNDLEGLKYGAYSESSFFVDFDLPVEVEYAKQTYTLGKKWRAYFRVIAIRSGNGYVSGLQLTRLGKRNRMGSSSFSRVHPHVDTDGKICWGGFSSMIFNCAKDWKVKEQMFLLQEWIFTYDDNDKYRSIDLFPVKSDSPKS